MQVETEISFARLPEVLRRLGISKSNLYKMIADGRFAAPYRLSDRISAWKKSDVDAWCVSRIQAPSITRPVSLTREERAKRIAAAKPVPAASRRPAVSARPKRAAIADQQSA